MKELNTSSMRKACSTFSSGFGLSLKMEKSRPSLEGHNIYWHFKHFVMFFEALYAAWKMSKIEFFLVHIFRIHSEYGKIRTRKNSELGHFSLNNKVISNFSWVVHVLSSDTRTQWINKHTIEEWPLVP